MIYVLNLAKSMKLVNKIFESIFSDVYHNVIFKAVLINILFHFNILTMAKNDKALLNMKGLIYRAF